MKAREIKALWAEHTRCEFELKDPEATMATMSDHPWINNVPTMTGGNGYDEVYHFYKHHFIPCIPEQTEVTTISCTVSIIRARAMDSLEKTTTLLKFLCIFLRLKWQDIKNYKQGNESAMNVKRVIEAPMQLM
jgi:hypothetical protein